MPQYISPGVYVQERDLSQYVSNLSATIVAMVGTADVGPANEPTLITSAPQYVSTFGQPSPDHYLGYAAISYLKQGSQLYVTRVAPTDAIEAKLTVPVPVDYTNYSGAWTLTSNTSTQATFTLENTAPTSATLTVVAAAKTITWTGGDWIAAGVVAGSRVTFSSFVASTGANNITLEVLSATTTVLTAVAATTGLVNEGSVTAGFLLSNKQLVALQDTDLVLPGFLFNDLTGTITAIDELGSDLLSFTADTSLVNSYLVGRSFSVTSGSGKSSSVPVLAAAPINSTSISMTVDATKFNAFNSPILAAATGSLYTIPHVATGFTPATPLVIASIGATSAATPGVINLKYSGVLCTCTNPTSIVHNDTAAAADKYTVAVAGNDIDITMPLYYTTDAISDTDAAKNATLIATVLNDIITQFRSSPAVTLPTKLLAASLIGKATANGIVGLGSYSSLTGVSSGIRSATVQTDGRTVLLSAIALGAFGKTNVTAFNFVTASNIKITGNFSLNLSRPKWSMVPASTSTVPLLFKFSSLGQGDFSNIAITVDLNKSNVNASDEQQYTVSLYARNPGLTVSPTSVVQSDFSLLEQFIGTPQVLQSKINSDSVYCRLKLDYTSDDLLTLDTALGTVVTAGDYLTPSFGLFTDQSGQGVISGGINTIVGSTSYASYATFLFAGSVGSTITKYDIIGDLASKTGIYSVSDPESLDINLLVVPGWSADPDVAKEMISLCVGRGDCMSILDTPFGLSVQNVIEYKNTILNSASNYAAIYYPWVEIVDTVNKKNIFVPPSGMVAGQYAYNDAVGDVFTAPAGRNRGNLLDALSTERVLNLGDRDALTLAQINPIYSEAGFGVYIRGQMTLQSATTALNRVNVRRLLLNLRKVIATASKYFEFEPGDSVTALRLKQLAESTLDDRVRKGAIRSYTVDVGPNVNTAMVLENNQLHMVISVVPTKTAEIIVEIFNILPQGQGISITNA